MEHMAEDRVMETAETQTTATTARPPAKTKRKKRGKKREGPFRPCNCHCKRPPCPQPQPCVMDVLPSCFPLRFYNPYADPNTVCLTLTRASCLPPRGRAACKPCTPGDIIDRYTYWGRPRGSWCECWAVAASAACHVAALLPRCCRLGAWLACLGLRAALAAGRQSCCRCCC